MRSMRYNNWLYYTNNAKYIIITLFINTHFEGIKHIFLMLGYLPIRKLKDNLCSFNHRNSFQNHCNCYT